MIIFLYGSDAYRRQRKLKEIIAEYKDKHYFLDLGNFDFEEETADEAFIKLQEFLANQSMFTNKKIAVLENIGNVPAANFKKLFQPYFTSQDIFIIISEENLPPSFNFLAEKPASAQNSDFLKGEKLKFFIQKEARARGINLSLSAIDFLAQFFESDTWGLITELDKLSLADNRKEISVNDLYKLNDYSPMQNIFSLISAIGQKYDKRKALTALEHLFIQQEEPAKIFNILAKQAERSPSFLNEMAGYDVMVKSGKMDYEEVLVDLILK